MLEAHPRIKIENVLGVSQATIPYVEWPVGVIGENSQGKSSVCTAIGALLTGNPNPLSFSNLKVYLHDGAEFGEVALVGAHGEEWRRWTVGERTVLKMPDAPEDVSAHCLSLTDFIRQPNLSRRVEIWEGVLLPDRSEMREKLTKQMTEAKVSEGMQRRVQKQLDDDPDWTSAHAVFHAHSKDAKRRWSTITGEAFGAKKAKTWTPKDPDWTAELLEQTVEDSTREFTAAEESLRVMQSADAIDESKRLEADSAAALLPDLQEKANTAMALRTEKESAYREHDKSLDNVRQEGRTRKGQLDKLRKLEPMIDESTPCPYCSAPLVIDHERNVYRREDESAFQERHARWQKQVDELETQQADTRARFIALKEQTKPLWQAFQDAKADNDAKTTKLLSTQGVAGLRAKAVKDDEFNARMSRTETRVNQLRRRLDLVQKYKRAEDAYTSFLGYEVIERLLGPTGVRASTVKEKLDSVYKVIDEICNVACWPTVTLDKNFVVHINHRPAILCSASEQWRAQFALQCAIAVVDKQNVVLADCADMLDDTHWANLLKLGQWLSREKGVAPIVCATMPEGSFGHPGNGGWSEVVMRGGISS